MRLEEKFLKFFALLLAVDSRSLEIEHGSVKVDGKPFRTVWIPEERDDIVRIIDQRALPFRFNLADLATTQEVAVAIRDQVREQTIQEMVPQIRAEIEKEMWEEFEEVMRNERAKNNNSSSNDD